MSDNAEQEAFRAGEFGTNSGMNLKALGFRKECGASQAG